MLAYRYADHSIRQQQEKEKKKEKKKTPGYLICIPNKQTAEIFLFSNSLVPKAVLLLLLIAAMLPEPNSPKSLVFAPLL